MKSYLFKLLCSSTFAADLATFDIDFEDFPMFNGHNAAIDYAEKLEADITNVRNSMARAQEVISSSIRKKAPPSYSGLMCWSCKADNMEQCIEKGEVEICDTLEDSCGLEERRWSGILVGLILGCKSASQCHYDINNNFIAEDDQCRPTEQGHSICRQCCGNDICNRGWNIRSESGWQYDYLT